MIYLLADVEQRGASHSSLEGEAYADDLERVREEHRGQPREGARREAPQPRLPVPRTVDEEGTVLLVSDELDGCIGVDLEERGRVAPEQPHYAVLRVDVRQGTAQASPGPGILGELRVACLKEDLDSVEGRDGGFGLLGREKVVSMCLFRRWA